MRLWLAISGACHIGLFVALSLCQRAETEPPCAPPVVFDSACAPEVAHAVDPPEPEPSLPPSEKCPEENLEQEIVEEPASPDEFDAQYLNEVKLPPDSRLNRRLFTIRIRRAAPPPPPRTPPPPPVVAECTRVAARLRSAPAIPYPQRARRRGLEGSVKLRFCVLSTGRVAHIEVIRSSGHAVLDEAAKATLSRWQFTPALRDGLPIAVWTHRTIRFELTARSP